MRFLLIFALTTLIHGCSLFGTYAWLHPQKTKAEQIQDKTECLALASIVYGSNEDLLNLAKSGKPQPNKALEADCLAEKGFQKTRVKTRTL